MGRGEWQIKEPGAGPGGIRGGLNVEFDGALIDESGGEGTEKLCDPRCVDSLPPVRTCRRVARFLGHRASQCPRRRSRL